MGKQLDHFESKRMKKSVPEFAIGDTVDVHVRIIEGEKQRIQVFTGTVIARKGTRNREMFTVRRIVAGEGVERVFPLHSPWIEDVRVRRSGKVRRAKLYYLRDRVGKATKVKERMAFEKKRVAKKPEAAQKAAPTPEATTPDEPSEPEPVGSSSAQEK